MWTAECERIQAELKKANAQLLELYKRGDLLQAEERAAFFDAVSVIESQRDIVSECLKALKQRSRSPDPIMWPPHRVVAFWRRCQETLQQMDFYYAS